MAQDLRNKYFVRKGAEEEWKDFSSLFDGLRVLSIDGFNEIGKAINIYNEQWIDEQEEDFMVTTEDNLGQPIVIRENINLSLTFIVSGRYATNGIDTREQHDKFIKYVSNGDFYIKSSYTGKIAHCALLDGYKPTTEKLRRGFSSYIIGTISLHTLDIPETYSGGVPSNNDLYIGFGAESISASQIPNLQNVQHYNLDDIAGTYTIQCNSLSYLWICTKSTIVRVVNDVFEVPMLGAQTIGEYRCYRSANSIRPHTMTFTIKTN